MSGLDIEGFSISTSQSEQETQKEIQNQNENENDLTDTSFNEDDIHLLEDNPILPQKNKRNFAVSEILDTERSYVDFLTIIVEEIKPDFEKFMKENKITEIDTRIIFADILPIFQVNKSLFEHLEKSFEREKEDCQIGEIFCHFIPFLKIYKNYIENYTTIENLIKGFKKKEQFSTWLQSIPHKYTLDLSSLLIMPVQRLPRYKLLLEEVLKKTDKNHFDYDKLIEAFEKISLVNEEINHSITKKEQMQKIIKIQKKFNNSQLNLVEPHRIFLQKGNFLIISHKEELKRYYFIFNDLLVIASRNFKIYQSEHSFPFSSIKLKDSDSYENPTSFEILGPKTSVIAKANSIQEKDSFLDTVRKAAREYWEGQKSFKRINQEKSKLAPIWIPDKDKLYCQICDIYFTTFVRKHHCRVCGDIICNSCSKTRLIIQEINSKPVRVCDNCAAKFNTEKKVKFTETDSLLQPQKKKSVKNLKQTFSLFDMSWVIVKNPKVQTKVQIQKMTRTISESLAITKGLSEKRVKRTPLDLDFWVDFRF
ncbi:faciogenital dysplasia protein [Anaeramoeba ignava]|uniref:Faciogenital dysplasia protein n=1 Tax=Anaeramoeba ignava TaxID=1746090 RepID=A0A9Q0R6S3_ANAIG|nr:faciogenital dysplasia protein [Anaeramoeba ignava]